MYAIVKQGGKQYRVAAGEEIVCDRVQGEVGGPFVFEKHLLVSDEGKTVVSDVDLAKYAIKAELVEHFDDDKILVFKYKAKKGYRRTRGHRQAKSRVRVLSIEPAKQAAKKVASKEVEAQGKTEAPEEAAPKEPKTETKTVKKAAGAKDKPAKEE